MGLGVKRQREDCEEKATKRGWNVVEVFTDNDVSATRSKVRPGYQRMIKAIEAGRIQAIVVWDVDRLTRSPRELEDVIDWADRHRLELASVTTEIDLGTPSGRAMARMKGTVAKLESEQMSLRLQRKMRELAEAGRYVGSRPFGWNWGVNDDGTKSKGLVLNDAEAAVVKECAERALRDEACHSIAQDLNRRGVATAAESRGWTSSHVRRMLLRPINAGFRVYEDVDYPGTWPEILTRTEHDRLVATLTDPRRLVKRGTPNRYLLSGLIHCALCGLPMRRNGGSKSRRQYRLSNGTVKTYEYERVEVYRCVPPGCNKVGQNLEGVEAMVTDYVLGLLEREEVEVFDGSSEKLKAAQEKLENVEAKMNLAAERLGNGKMTFEQFDRFNAIQQPQKEQAQMEIRRAQPEEWMTEFTGLSARTAWERADLDLKRDVLRWLGNRGLEITVGQPGQKGSRLRKLEGKLKTFNPDTVYIKANWR